MTNIVSIARREATLSVALAVLYLGGWWLSAYMVPPTLMLGGWPLWFVLSCLFNPLLFVVLCVLMVRYCFKTVALDDSEPELKNSPDPASKNSPRPGEQS